MIFIENLDGFGSEIMPSLIKNSAQITQAYLLIPDSDSLTIVITSDPKIQDLNHQFRGIDSPTDVLSFPAGYQDPEVSATYLGDVIISYPRALSQAEQRGHSVEDEIQLLVVHGILHLVGHDHGDPTDKAKMWAAQDAVLVQLDISFDILGGQ
jgi:probable rRNA maturation factor